MKSMMNQGTREHNTPKGEVPAGSNEPENTNPRDEVQNSALNWLFVDLNSYFASVEQEVCPELRGRPVGIVPMMADTTCCIAASYEAKAFGVKTGTMVADAKRMCPGLVLVEARHELYVAYHHRIVKAVESCLPVTAVLSVDEMACRLIGRERPLLAAMKLGRQVKERILERVGPMIRSSVGLATNRYLAKIASDMEKPDGLVALTPDILPGALRQLALRDLPGIGARMEKRLNAKGIRTMDDLLALDCDNSGQVWGSVLGERLWHWLHGEDFDMDEVEHLKSMSHQHVLAPEMRTPEKAWAVAHKLLHKAAMRLRASDLWASSIGLAIGFAVPRSEKKPVSSFGVPTRGWIGAGAAPREPRGRDGRDQQQVRPEHAGPRDHADRLQGRAHAHRLPHHSGDVLTDGKIQPWQMDRYSMSESAIWRQLRILRGDIPFLGRNIVSTELSCHPGPQQLGTGATRRSTASTICCPGTSPRLREISPDLKCPVVLQMDTWERVELCPKPSIQPVESDPKCPVNAVQNTAETLQQAKALSFSW